MEMSFNQFISDITTVVTKTRLAGCSTPTSWCWGAEEYCKYHNADYSLEFLQFKVNGYKHKGLVRIIMDRGQDLLDVELLNYEANKVLYRINGLYIDQIVEVIDNLVETIGYEPNIIY